MAVQQTTSPAVSDTRSLLLRAAASEFNENGVTSQALTNIAQRVGLSRASVYTHFDDTAELLAACYLGTCAFLSECLPPLGACAPIDAITTFIDRALEPGAQELAAIGEFAHLSDAQRAEVRAAYDSLCDGIAGHISAGMENSEIRELNPHIVAQAIIGLITWPVLAPRWNPLVETLDRDAVTQVVKASVAEGILRKQREKVVIPRREIEKWTLPATSIFDAEEVAAAKRDALLAHGSWLLNREGVDAATLDKVANHYGVSKSVIYHNVGAKDAFISACYRRAFDMFVDVSETLIEPETPAEQSLAGAIYTIANAYQSSSRSPLAPTVGTGSLDEDLRAELQVKGTVLAQNYMQAMTRGAISGALANDELLIRTVLIPGLFEWVPRWSDKTKAPQRAAIAIEIARFWALGLKP